MGINRLFSRLFNIKVRYRLRASNSKLNDFSSAGNKSISDKKGNNFIWSYGLVGYQILICMYVPSLPNLVALGLCSIVFLSCCLRLCYK